MTEQIELNIIRITSEGQGVGFSDRGKIVLVQGVNNKDVAVKAEVIQELEETIIAKKISRVSADKEERTDLSDSPYEMDEDDEDEDDDY